MRNKNEASAERSADNNGAAASGASKRAHSRSHGRGKKEKKEKKAANGAAVVAEQGAGKGVGGSGNGAGKGAGGEKVAGSNGSGKGNGKSSGGSNGSGKSSGNGGRGSQAKHGGKKHAPKLRIIPLGGLDGIGKNMTAFECGGDMIVVDAGMMFPDDDYPGIDLLVPDYTYILENSDKLRGIIITHGHEDHTGAIPYVLKDLDSRTQILASKLTLGFIEGKLDEHRFHDVKMREVSAGQRVQLGCFDVEFFSVNHSIPGAMGVFLRTPAGNVLHTGDFKLDQTPIDGIRTDFAAMSRFADEGIDLLMSDSTNANVEKFTRSEAEVGKVIDDIISHAKGRVVVASFASHIHRIQQICNATVKNGRKVAVTGRSMLTNTRIARELGYLDINESDIVDSYAVNDMPRNQMVVLCTGSQGEPLSALTRIANGEHRTIDIERGDTVIISASPVPGNEKAVIRVKNALAKIGVDFYDKDRALVHVSGHAGREELKIVMAICRPRNFMPIHGEEQHLQAHAELARSMGIPDSRIFVLENGNTLEMTDGKIARGGNVDSGVVFVEGLTVGDVSELVLKDRKTLGDEGVATVVIMISKRDGRPLDDAEVIMRGVTGGDDATLLDDATSAVRSAISGQAHDYRLDPRSIKRTARDTLSKFLWDRCRRRPLIVPIVIEV